MIGSFLSNIFGMIGVTFGGQAGTQNQPPQIIQPPNNNTPLVVVGGLVLVVVLVFTMGGRGR